MLQDWERKVTKAGFENYSQFKGSNPVLHLLTPSVTLLQATFVIST